MDRIYYKTCSSYIYKHYKITKILKNLNLKLIINITYDKL